MLSNELQILPNGVVPSIRVGYQRGDSVLLEQGTVYLNDVLIIKHRALLNTFSMPNHSLLKHMHT